MAEPCQRRFDEELLSGYLDGALTQASAQRVRLHLEDCASCRALYEELAALRKTTMSTHFTTPPAESWGELPRTAASRFTRTFGWLVVVAWLAVAGGYGTWRFLTEAGDGFHAFMVLGVPGGFFLLLVSALLDRLRDLKTDRYRGVDR